MTDFLKTNTNLILTVSSNRTQRNIQVKAANKVQKIRVNINGDQFKLALWLPDESTDNVVVSDLSAIVAYGKRGKTSMKACVVKFFKKIWAIIMHIFCFFHCKEHDDETEQSE